MLEERRKGKHLTLEDRQLIQKGLRERRSFAEIANSIGCSPVTVSMEIRKHRYLKKIEDRNRVPINNCKYRYTCKRRDVCQRPKGKKCRIPCRDCLRCNSLCPDYIYAPCRIKEKAPYVCNNCSHSRTCLREKYLYNASYAHKEYLHKLSYSRQGINLTRDELAGLDALVSPLILKGQPVSHIFSNHSEEIPCSMRTLYGYVENGYLTAKPLDMRRAVRYKKRRTDKEIKTSPRKKAGHHYRDFQKLLEENPNIRVVEMDTVEGTKGGKVLQTFLWRENNLMLAFLLENKMMESAVATIDKLEMALGIEKFKELFPVILTDNGSEFADPDLFEVNRDGEIRTSIYYCDSRKPEQKGSLEKNHEYIRYVVPKGKPFDDYIQEQITMMINNINSTIRPQSGKSPAAMAMESFGEDVMKKLGLTIVEPDEVHLMPSLLK